MFFSLREVAASSYSGARALQWPHHGAKTVKTDVSGSSSIEALHAKEELTLSEDDVVALNELVKVVLLQLYDIGSGSGCRGCEQTESNALGVHCDCECRTSQQR